MSQAYQKTNGTKSQFRYHINFMTIADLSPLAGITEHLGLSKVDPVTLRDALRQAMSQSL